MASGMRKHYKGLHILPHVKRGSNSQHHSRSQKLTGYLELFQRVSMQRISILMTQITFGFLLTSKT